jgi:hypothetical protein
MRGERWLLRVGEFLVARPATGELTAAERARMPARAPGGWAKAVP